MIAAAAQSASVAGDVAGNAARHLALARSAADRGARIVVFPELSLTGYELGLARDHVIAPDAEPLDPMRRLARESGMAIVVGCPVRGDRGELHIGAITMLGDGAVRVYTKIHVHSSEAHVFTCGAGGADLEIDGTRVGLAICRDAAIPGHAADAASRGVRLYAAGVMIDEEGYGRKVPLMERYAREHGMAVLMANYSGISGGDVSAGRTAIWRPGGEIAAMAAGGEETLVVADL